MFFEANTEPIEIVVEPRKNVPIPILEKVLLHLNDNMDYHRRLQTRYGRTSAIPVGSIMLDDVVKNIGTTFGNAKFECDRGEIYQGNFASRLHLFATRRFNMGGIISSYNINQWLENDMYVSDKTNRYFYKVYYGMDWKAGSFGDSPRSCWWTYSDASHGRKKFHSYARNEQKCFALQLFSQGGNGVGRCLCVYHGENIIFFNAYGPQYAEFAEILAQMIGNDATWHRLEGLTIGRDFYLNDSGIIVGHNHENVNRINIASSFDTYVPYSDDEAEILRWQGLGEDWKYCPHCEAVNATEHGSYCGRCNKSLRYERPKEGVLNVDYPAQ